MMRTVLLSLCLAAAVAVVHSAPAQLPGFPSFQQPASAPTGTGVIVGRTVDAVTGRPVQGVLVALSGAPKALSSLQVGDAIPMDQLMSLDLGSMIAGMHQVLTDSQGRFVFTGLPKGTFSLAGIKSGWIGGNYGQRRPDSAPVPFELADGEQATNVTLQFWKNSTITGEVIDEAGEPIVGLSVQALRRTWTAGHARYSVAGGDSTDDRGAYRIAGLRAGDYVIAIPQTPVTAPATTGAGAPNLDLAGLQSLISARAAGADPNLLFADIAAMSSRSSGGIRVGDWVLQASSVIPPILSADGHMLAYRTTYFPTATVSAQGSTISVTSGDERSGVDLQLRPLPVMRVSGVVTGPSGPVASTQVRLLPGGDDGASEDGIGTATTTTAGDGSFTFLAVPAGQYALRVVQNPKPASPSAAALAALGGLDQTMIQNSAGGMTMSMGPMNMGALLGAMPGIPSEPTLFASMTVSVGESDVTGLVVPLRPGFRISGRAEFEGAGKKPAFDALRRLPISIERADVGNPSAIPMPNIGGGQGGQFDASGQFTTFSLLPGKYFVRVPFSTGGWTLKSAMLGGKDVADVPLEIENADVAGVVLTFTDQRSNLSGLVRDVQGAPDTLAAVVVFPATSDSWIDFGSAPRRLRVAKTDKEGRYQVAGLPAGTYLVAAVPDDLGTEWQNPQVLESLSRGAARVTIGDGEKRTQDLRVNK